MMRPHSDRADAFWLQPRIVFLNQSITAFDIQSSIGQFLVDFGSNPFEANDIAGGPRSVLGKTFEVGSNFLAHRVGHPFEDYPE
jgi:hypothetical protein